jgi:hypothetical protein
MTEKRKGRPSRDTRWVVQMWKGSQRFACSPDERDLTAVIMGVLRRDTPHFGTPEEAEAYRAALQRSNRHGKYVVRRVRPNGKLWEPKPPPPPPGPFPANFDWRLGYRR